MTLAAGVRNLTQSAVSQQIKRLELTVGCALLARRANGVSLTKSGRLLLPLARGIVARNDEAIEKVLGKALEHDVRLGVPQDVVLSLLPKVLARFHKKHPKINVTLVSASSFELMAMVDECEVDFALTTDRIKEPRAELIFQKRLIWIGAENGRAHLRDPLPVAVGSEICPFRQAATEALASKAMAWRPVTQVGSLEPVFATLIADMAVAPFLPGNLPCGTSEIKEEGLPKLPEFCLQLRSSSDKLRKSAKILMRTIVGELRS